MAVGAISAANVGRPSGVGRPMPFGRPILLFLKILMMPLTNPRVLKYLIIALRILMTIVILLTISKGSLHKRKRLMHCRTLQKKKLLKTKCSLDEKEEESDEQKEEEWSSYPSQPTNQSNSLNITLYDFSGIFWAL